MPPACPSSARATPFYPLPVPEVLDFSAIALGLEHLDNPQHHADLAQRLQQLAERFDESRQQPSATAFATLRQRIGRSPRRFPAAPRPWPEFIDAMAHCVKSARWWICTTTGR